MKKNCGKKQRCYKERNCKCGAKEGDIRQKDFFGRCRGSGIIIVSILPKTSSALLRGFAL